MKYDYRKAELWYCRHKGSTLKSCAKKYKIPFNSLSKKAAADGWTAKKQKYCEKVVKEAKEKSLTADSDALAAAARTAEAAVGLIERTVGDDRQFNKYIVSEGSDDGGFVSVEREFDKVDMKALRDCVSALKDLIGILRNVKGIPTQAESFYQELQRQRLELEQKKAEQDDDKGGEIVVKFANNEEMSE